mmetsp:Transcript_4165/g.11757  ORF Transcript_4165/g.11757 Transcript_4165/m.11757 type:complete len:234 (+) Transcript_4165:586-1287(+)
MPETRKRSPSRQLPIANPQGEPQHNGNGASTCVATAPSLLRMDRSARRSPLPGHPSARQARTSFLEQLQPRIRLSWLASADVSAKSPRGGCTTRRFPRPVRSPVRPPHTAHRSPQPQHNERDAWAWVSLPSKSQPRDRTVPQHPLPSCRDSLQLHHPPRRAVRRELRLHNLFLPSSLATRIPKLGPKGPNARQRPKAPVVGSSHHKHRWKVTAISPETSEQCSLPCSAKQRLP